MRRSLLMLLIMCLTVFQSAQVTIAQTNSPFIYYYSQDRAEFIIERADGSERRILATYALHPEPPIYEHITGPGWSRSGKWFAWSSSLDAGGGGKHNVYLVNREGATPLKVFSADIQVEEMKWSPTSDLLLVAYFDDSANEKALIYDPIQHKAMDLINAGSVDGLGESIDGDWFRSISWSQDGQLVTLQTYDKVAVIQVNTEVDHIISSLSVAESVGNICSDFGTLPHWLNNRRLAYQQPDNSALIVENTDTRNKVSYPLPKGTLNYVDWSHDEQYALLYIAPDPDKFKFNLWLLSLATQTVEHIADNVLFGTNCDVPVPFNDTAWNILNQAVFASEDGQPRIISVAPTRLVKVVLPPTFKIQAFSPLTWQSNGSLVFIATSINVNGDRIYSYSVNTRSLRLLTPQSNTQSISFFSMFGESYLADNTEGQACIHELKSGQQSCKDIQVAPNYGAIGVSEMLWHPGGKWLFILGEVQQPLWLINIMTVDGTVQRSLTECVIGSVSCSGWLPDQADSKP